jgi:hypothetical protein
LLVTPQEMDASSTIPKRAVVAPEEITAGSLLICLNRVVFGFIV